MPPTRYNKSVPTNNTIRRDTVPPEQESMHVTLAWTITQRPCTSCTSQSLGKAPPAPMESILVNSQTEASLNVHAGHPFGLSFRTYGEVMTDEQPLIMRMIFHLLWLISLSREWHLGSHLRHIFMYRRVMFLFLTSYFSHSFFLSWKQTHTECHVLWLGPNFCGGWCWKKFDVHWGSLESFLPRIT